MIFGLRPKIMKCLCVNLQLAAKHILFENFMEMFMSIKMQIKQRNSSDWLNFYFPVTKESFLGIFKNLRKALNVYS